MVAWVCLLKTQANEATVLHELCCSEGAETHYLRSPICAVGGLRWGLWFMSLWRPVILLPIPFRIKHKENSSHSRNPQTAQSQQPPLHTLRVLQWVEQLCSEGMKQPPPRGPLSPPPHTHLFCFNEFPNPWVLATRPFLQGLPCLGIDFPRQNLSQRPLRIAMVHCLSFLPKDVAATL